MYDSALEMRFYRDWILPKMESGEIVSCERQIKYELQQKFKHNDKNVLPINYVADFVTIDKDGKVTVWDVKGQPDSVALLKRKLFWFKYPDVDYRWVTYSKQDGGWLDYEYVKACRKQRKKDREEKTDE